MRKCCMAGLAAVASAVIFAVFPVYAHDIEWGIRHGEQDALVLGTVKEAGEDWVLLEEVIPLPCDRTTTIYRQLEPEQIPATMKVANVQPYAMSYHDKTRAEAGDCMMVSADQDGNQWKALYRPYEVSSMDTATLEFLPEERKTRDSAAWEAFVRSGGADSEFSFGDGKVYVKRKGADGTEETVVLFEEAVTETEPGAANPAADAQAGPEAAIPAAETEPATSERPAGTAPPAPEAASTDPAPPSTGGISPLALGFLWGGVGFVAAFAFSRRNKK